MKKYLIYITISTLIMTACLYSDEFITDITLYIISYLLFDNFLDLKKK